MSEKGKYKTYRVSVERSETPLFEAFLAVDYMTPAEFFKKAKDAYCAKATQDPKYGDVWNRHMASYRTYAQVNQEILDYQADQDGDLDDPVDS